MASRRHTGDALRETLTRIFASRPRAGWLDTLAAEDTCVAPVLSLAQAGASEDLVDMSELGHDTAAWRSRLGLG